MFYLVFQTEFVLKYIPREIPRANKKLCVRHANKNLLSTILKSKHLYWKI